MKSPKWNIEAFTDDEVKKIIHAFDTSKSYIMNPYGEFIRLRDMYIFQVMTALMLRPGECLYMKWSDIDWEESIVRLNPYTNKERETDPVILNFKARELLLSWRSIFESYSVSEYVFPSLRTFLPISSNMWGRRLGKILDEAGVRKVLWYTSVGQPIYNKKPYSSRKTGGTLLLRHGADLETVRRALRHKDFRQISRYSDLCHSEIKNKIDQFL